MRGYILNGLVIIGMLWPTKPVLAQLPPTTVLDPRMFQLNGSELAALFDVFGNTVQKEINNRLYNIQPAYLKILWPVNRIVEAPSYFERDQRGSQIPKIIEILNKNFPGDQNEIKKMVAVENSDVVRINDLIEALEKEKITLNLATRVLFNRKTVLQLLRCGGAKVTYKLDYSGGNSIDQEVKDDDLKWVFRFYQPKGAEAVPGILLAAVDVVTDSTAINLIRSGEGVEYLKKATATAEFVSTSNFLTLDLPKQGQSPENLTIENLNNLAGGGKDKPLVIEFAEKGLEHLFRKAEEVEAKGKASIGVVLGLHFIHLRSIG